MALTLPLAKHFIPSIVTEFQTLIKISPQLSSINVIDLVNPWSAFGHNNKFEWSFTPNGEKSTITVAVILSKNQNVANNFLNYFSEEERFQAKKGGDLSVQEYFDMYLKTSGKTPIEIYTILYTDPKVKQPSFTKVALAYAVYMYFNAKVVFDPTPEYGGRMIGAALSNVQVYHGVSEEGAEASERKALLPGALTKFLQSQSSKYNNFSLLPAGATPTENSYDTVFMTVPQFELGSAESGAQLRVREAEKEWGESFMYPLLKSSSRALVREGHLILHYKSPKYMSPLHEYLSSQKHLKMKFLGTIAILSEAYLTSADAEALFVYRRT